MPLKTIIEGEANDQDKQTFVQVCLNKKSREKLHKELSKDVGQDEESPYTRMSSWCIPFEVP